MIISFAFLLFFNWVLQFCIGCRLSQIKGKKWSNRINERGEGLHAVDFRQKIRESFDSWSDEDILFWQAIGKQINWRRRKEKERKKRGTKVRKGLERGNHQEPPRTKIAKKNTKKVKKKKQKSTRQRETERSRWEG